MTEPSVAGEQRVVLEPFPDMPLEESLHFANRHCEQFGCPEAPEAEAAAFRAKMGEKG